MLLSAFCRKPVEKKVLRCEGEFHNLRDIYDRVNEEYFNQKVDVSITWMRRIGFLPRARIILGSYHAKQRVIKIHRALDSGDVPDYFIAFVVYHEMLHHELPPKNGLSKRSIHHRDFAIKEREFRLFSLAKDFEKEFVRAIFNKCRPSM
jgi:hypothetical protein